ncbi:MAG TPA: DNA repair protein RadA [Bacteroidales bacterium]|nr:DNA repair protein RadA [Bacteroidales bacterium]
MAKSKSVFICSNCGNEAAKWIGKCPSCGEWNTYVEEVIYKSNRNLSFKTGYAAASPVKITSVKSDALARIDTRISELNRILGGGMVPGSLMLIGGEPGIGKSTLVLQLALILDHLKVLYVSGEESAQQIKMRADRIAKVQGENCYLLGEVLIENIFAQVENVKPDLIIVDSIQTIYSESGESLPGSVTQVRDCTSRFLKFAKESSIPVILVGHITKDGTLAGPKILEHIVDVVLLFEGENTLSYRVLRTTKNRYGSTSELGIFEMHENGLIEVTNPSEILLSHSNEELSGIATAATIDGHRPFLIEVQALVSTAAYGTPQRSTTGFDVRRLNMLLAVLEKRAGFKIAAKDVFLNIAGGIKVTDPAIDLAVISSVISSGLDRPIPNNICFAGEISLSGEVRPVNHIEQRIREAEKLGFQKIVVSGYNNLKSVRDTKIKVIKANKVEQAIRYLFSKNQ